MYLKLKSTKWCLIIFLTINSNKYYTKPCNFLRLRHFLSLGTLTSGIQRSVFSSCLTLVKKLNSTQGIVFPISTKLTFYLKINELLLLLLPIKKECCLFCLVEKKNILKCITLPDYSEIVISIKLSNLHQWWLLI